MHHVQLQTGAESILVWQATILSHHRSSSPASRAMHNPSPHTMPHSRPPILMGQAQPLEPPPMAPRLLVDSRERPVMPIRAAQARAMGRKGLAAMQQARLVASYTFMHPHIASAPGTHVSTPDEASENACCFLQQLDGFWTCNTCLVLLVCTASTSIVGYALMGGCVPLSAGQPANAAAASAAYSFGAGQQQAPTAQPQHSYGAPGGHSLLTAAMYTTVGYLLLHSIPPEVGRQLQTCSMCSS